MGIMPRWKEWMEYRPAPLELSDSEILEWITEYCKEVVYKLPTPNYLGGFTVQSDDGVKTCAETLRDAVRLAAAKQQEANQ